MTMSSLSVVISSLALRFYQRPDLDKVGSIFARHGRERRERRERTASQLQPLVLGEVEREEDEEEGRRRGMSRGRLDSGKDADYPFSQDCVSVEIVSWGLNGCRDTANCHVGTFWRDLLSLRKVCHTALSFTAVNSPLQISLCSNATYFKS